jgi:hypothetical protein
MKSVGWISAAHPPPRRRGAPTAEPERRLVDAARPTFSPIAGLAARALSPLHTVLPQRRAEPRQPGALIRAVEQIFEDVFQQRRLRDGTGF